MIVPAIRSPQFEGMEGTTANLKRVTDREQFLAGGGDRVGSRPRDIRAIGGLLILWWRTGASAAFRGAAAFLRFGSHSTLSPPAARMCVCGRRRGLHVAALGW